MQLVWAQNVHKKTGKPVLVLTPLSVGPQTVREGHKFGIEAAQSRDGKIAAPITVTNYQQLHKFDSTEFSGCACDECFPKNTLVETVENGIVSKRYIQDIRYGQTIRNAAGDDRVVEVHRRRIERAVKVTAGEHRITSSEHHPFYTQRGWVQACKLEEGDYLMETATAMRLVSCGVCSEVPGIMEHEVLRDILFSEMANETAGVSCECSQPGSREAQGRIESEMVQGGKPNSTEGDRADSHIESDGRSRDSEQDDPDIASDEVETFRTWRKREGYDEAAIHALGGVTKWVGERVCLVVGTKESGLSDLLQTGLSESSGKNLHRSGWSQPQVKEGSGQQEGQYAGFVRVEGVEILECGHPELDQWRDANGVVYFYDIKAERHPSFSVEGLLVHNSSILKNFDGVLKGQITEFMLKMPYRSLWTATAAPNDYIELGNSSEALGHMRRVEMMAQFFNHDGGDTSKWRLKKHAEKHLFWRWICTWARAIRKPSDIGFSNDGFDLPELRIREHIVKSRTKNEEYLFDMPAIGLDEQRKERRRTIHERCELVAELVSKTGKPSLSWCHLNEEGTLLEKLIPDSVNVEGSDSDEFKEEAFEAFINGKIKNLISKPVIAGLGLNLQHCAHETFFPSHSFEQWYQAIRRCWRFGQTQPVTVDVISSEGEAGVVRNMARKSEQAEVMFTRMVELLNNELKIETNQKPTTKEEIPSWL